MPHYQLTSQNPVRKIKTSMVLLKGHGANTTFCQKNTL